MSGLRIGHARVSTGGQNLTAQCEVLAACRTGDTLVVIKLDHLARLLPAASSTSSPAAG